MSNNTSYDKALLDEAPEVTPQQRQRFYDADLLNDDRQRDGLPAGAAAPIAARSNTDLEAGVVHGKRSKEYAQLPLSSTAIRSSTKTPWYKTRKGIIGLVILAIVIIGAVVGGAVGGTVGKNDDDNSDFSISTVPSTSSSTEQGSGTAPIASPSPTPTTTTQEAPVGSGTTSPEATPTPDPGQQGASDAVAVADDAQTAV
ncbi:hypothetical protein A7U60_g6864 [Sanghuangporus baumii]|uniref:Uncharacterized protein n=1 Tax=Sanghuangporus baumii TaxID=108892 RepID=A0A9Q5HU60_SANBA|nr:hypothetical protein A7U60_g6864 [Sanghuangporus baumii]